jgi:hypothetical protein
MASNQTTSIAQIFARIIWMVVGPATLALLLFSITSQGRGWLAPVSLAFPAVLILVIIARWLDPLTSDGEPSTPAHLRQYVVRTLGLGLGAWVVANLLGIYWLGA